MTNAISMWWTAILGDQGEKKRWSSGFSVSSVLSENAWDLCTQRVVCLTSTSPDPSKEYAQLLLRPYHLHAAHCSTLCLRDVRCCCWGVGSWFSFSLRKARISVYVRCSCHSAHVAGGRLILSECNMHSSHVTSVTLASFLFNVVRKQSTPGQRQLSSESEE